MFGLILFLGLFDGGTVEFAGAERLAAVPAAAATADDGVEEFIRVTYGAGW